VGLGILSPVFSFFTVLSLVVERYKRFVADFAFLSHNIDYLFKWDIEISTT
jgi:hypothetical protein